MKLLLTLLTLLHMHEIPQLKDQALIESTCRNTANYQLCISTLLANPKSATADVAGLGLIIVDAVKAKTEEALSAIEEMKGLHPEQRYALERCTAAYKAVLIADIPESVAALTKGVPKFADFGMSDAAWEAEICEGSFERVAETPLSGVNKDLRELAEVAKGIIKILL
ncbi:hypothetical protein CDL12_09594 [Handroanthus impetiginosus]|uniref:Pectinesterase inhibitor domain-containing protein n=1 Tax=Handroanthus impetiginosus TaxID=429701 RepID=A0A2G9HJP5_9LAMI|nr:hypothetical protein CDL12_09594 [Handroanthus impetiginosus]